MENLEINCVDEENTVLEVGDNNNETGLKAELFMCIEEYGEDYGKPFYNYGYSIALNPEKVRKLRDSLNEWLKGSGNELCSE